MDNCNENIAAIKMFTSELILGGLCEYNEVRLHCITLVYTCFLMEIEPRRLPLSKHFKGDLSECQKRCFWQQYLSLYMNSDTERYQSMRKIIDNAPAWSYLLNLTDEIIDTLAGSRG